MKTFALAIICLTLSAASAQTSSKTTNTSRINKSTLNGSSRNPFSKPNDSITKGIRVGLTKPFYNGNSHITVTDKVSTGSASDTSTIHTDYSQGLKFGYAYLPVRDLGYIADFDYVEVSMGNRSTNIARLSGNAAVAITPIINIHAGLNYTDWVGKHASRFSPGFGNQVGVGFQITRNFGFELNYSESNVDFDIKGFDNLIVNGDLKFKGYDFNLIGTF